jgi:hypothetical protein
MRVPHHRNTRCAVVPTALRKLPRSVACALLCLSAAVALTAAAATNAVADPAEQAALAWLAAADAGDGAQTWSLAAPMFQSSVTSEQWTRALAAARGPLGALHKRTLSSLTHATSLPGAPDGDYAVLRFSSEFERKAAAVETVTTARQPDGAWKIAGYFIK